MNRISLLFLVLATIWQSGCFQRVVNFDQPPFVILENEPFPKVVEKKFKKRHGDTLIQQVEFLTWLPTGKRHFRLTFEKDGKLMETRYDQNGKLLGKPVLVVRNADTQ